MVRRWRYKIELAWGSERLEMVVAMHQQQTTTFTHLKSYGMDFKMMTSVLVSNVGVTNCEQTAVNCYRVREFVGKKMNIQNSDVGFKFSFYLWAQQELHDVNFQNCTEPMYLNSSENVNQHNVCIS
eukprot:TRINITY_DN17414_c1_g1_i1.p1 TRINITY_DN17414_c1_g1~~TRINITY_DN17414_c1_g1_i1.p1  ORF type:complete len:126 (+),score=8.13 TRINITY_DN17414_c1_g1_i1:81-458(+)